MTSGGQSQRGVVGRSLVAGERSSERGETFYATHPSTGVDRSIEFCAATESDVERAASAGADAFDALRSMGGAERAKMLEGAADRIQDLGGVLLDAACGETGLAKPRVTGERDRTVKQLRLFGAMAREGSWVEAVIDRGDGERRPLPKPDVRRMLRPLGPVVVFGASNFPLAYSVAGGDTASALCAGCPVVVKGHSAHPATGELVARALCDAVAGAGLPAGTFSFLHAGGSRDVAVGVELVTHPLVAAGGFTGSVAAGCALAELASRRARPIPFFAEMGSVNPVVVLGDALSADAEGIGAALFASFTNSAGQMCTCPGLIFVLAGEGCERLCAKLGTLVAGAVPQTMLTARIRAAWEKGVADSIGAGATTLAGASASGAGAAPVVLRVRATEYRKSARLHEECFGPSTVVVECGSVQEMIECVGEVGGSLTGTLWATERDARAGEVLRALERIAGRVVVNGVPTGVEVCDAMVHSGPFPACSRPESTAVGSFAVRRWCRPVAFQSTPDHLLPAELRDANPLRISRIEDGARRDPR